MSIFDDPGKALRRLEEELLAEEAPEEFEEEEWDGDVPVNYAVDFGRTVYADEETDDDAVYFEEDYRADRKARKRKKKGTAGLRFVILLELAGIAAVIWWWIRWLN